MLRPFASVPSVWPGKRPACLRGSDQEGRQRSTQEAPPFLAHCICCFELRVSDSTKHAKMARWQILLLCCLLASTAFVQNVRCEEGSGDAEDDEDYADAERAFLIVRKHVKDTVGVQGRNFTVYMDVYNAGSV